MVERYIEVTDEYVKQLEHEIDDLKAINEKHKKLNGELREENKKQKEVIDKAIEFIEKNSKQCLTNKIDEQPTKVIGKFMWHIDDLLDILKESGE